MLLRHRQIVLSVLLLVVFGLAVVWLLRRPQHLCYSESGETLLLLSEAQSRLQDYLVQSSLTARAEVREEGSFMLGAYPRPNVLWLIRIQQPPLSPDEARLRDVARTAYCLRPGWVWLHFTTPADERQFRSFSQDELAHH